MLRSLSLAHRATPLTRHLSGTAGSGARNPRPFPELPQARRDLPAASESFVRARAAHLEREAECRAGGGPRGVERHVKRNKKMLVRDRLKRILDEARRKSWNATSLLLSLSLFPSRTTPSLRSALPPAWTCRTGTCPQRGWSQGLAGCRYRTP